jgi:hypothetical protein
MGKWGRWEERWEDGRGRWDGGRDWWEGVARRVEVGGWVMGITVP